MDFLGFPEGLILLHKLHPKPTLGSVAPKGPLSPNSQHMGAWCQQDLPKVPVQGPGARLQTVLSPGG